MLSLIPPQLEYLPAVFPPNIRDLPPPALEKYNLDNHFASPAILLAQLTNSCKSESLDLEYFSKGYGEILNVFYLTRGLKTGIMSGVPKGEKNVPVSPSVPSTSS
mmetsp:Transcript_32762/g.64922  ORF Transcript_32762/g.64922 Transcript_32762/m.64922 type:complete len:105 (-) Transcript_32762:34-348(-)